MCLIPESEIKVAEENIRVYKKVNISVDSWIPSITGIGIYKFNEVIKAVDNLKPVKSSLSSLEVIITGFHAFSDKIELPGYPEKPNAIIPRGSEYCLGRNGDIVANQIIVFRDNKELEDYVSTSK